MSNLAKISVNPVQFRSERPQLVTFSVFEYVHAHTYCPVVCQRQFESLIVG